ncbi:MAG: cell division protein FtsQ/DivIB [Paracoccaceae bacterium]
MQRWMLTPGIRLGLRVGIPFALVFAISSAFLASEERRDALNLFVAEVRSSIQERPEFMVGLMAIDGASQAVSEDIREVVPIDFPISSFDLNLEEIRDVIVGLDPVRDATVRIRPGGLMEVQVVERIPVVVWRNYEGVTILDDTGAHVAELPSRKTRSDLPLIVGEGADQHVREALSLFAVAAPLADRVRAMARVGERRWDVVLDREQRILLPADRPIQALQRVIALNQVQDLLDRDLAVIDMRIGERPTLRMTNHAVEEWRRIRQLNNGG